MAHGEGPETEHGLQLAQVLAPGLLPLAVLFQLSTPTWSWSATSFNKGGNGSQFIDARDDAGKAQVTELHREAQPIGWPAPLSDDREVGIVECVMSDQVVLWSPATPAGFPARRRTGWNDVAYLLIHRSQVLIQGFATDSEFTSKLGLLLASPGTVAKLAMRQPFCLIQRPHFKKLCFTVLSPRDHHNKMLRPAFA